MTTLHRSSRKHEQGGIAILIALTLLSVMTIAAFAVSSDSLREINITGTESTGRKASEAADSGIDWVVAWSNPDALTFPSSGAEKSIQLAMGDLINALETQPASTSTDPQPNDPFQSDYTSYRILNTTTGSLRVFLRSGDSAYQNTSMQMAKKGDVGFQQDTVVQQAFDVEIRYLGPSLINTSSGQKAKKRGTLFMIRTVGRANIGQTGQSFIAKREVLVDYNP
ncbi:MAG TPA: hypothetical protein VJ600_10400 [Holophagaceae bacterium]|nr:hypothetical protein [Holophagaceae bacterium]